MTSNQASPIFEMTYHNKIYATSRKVAGSIPSDFIGCSNVSSNPSSRTMSLALSLSLIEISTRNIPGE
jgi:hypothetical protein